MKAHPLPSTTPLSSSKSVHFSLDLERAHEHIISVTLTVEDPSELEVFELPVWIPGSYLVREFSKEILKIKAQQNNRALVVEQLSKNTWQVRASSDKPLTLEYEVFAHDASVRTAWLDTQRGFFNGTSLFLRPHSKPNAAYTLEVKAPSFNSKWKLATALTPGKVKANGFGLYQARNYEQLIDCPVEMGEFWSGEFTCMGVSHRLVVSGAAPSFDGERLLKDVQKICETEIKFWHGKRKPSLSHYLFILWAVADGYGGLEHENSTALIASRADLPRKGLLKPNDGYIQLLGLFSHEYFHTWNVKRLKPKEFLDLDLSRENYTQMLWFFEGFTSYYDDLILFKAGLIDTSEYLKLLNKTLNQVLQTPGRLLHSAANSSFEAWTKYYRPEPNTANMTVSYYTKGALIALCFDLTLRQLHPSKTKSLTCDLDQVMKTLFERFAKTGLDEEDFLAVLKDISGKDFSKELNSWVHSTKELPVAHLLSEQGVEVREEPAQWAQRLGLRLSDAPPTMVVKQVLKGGPAHAAGLCPGDEWLGIEVGSKQNSKRESWRMQKIEDWALYVQDQKEVELIVSRDRRILKLPMKISTMNHSTTLRLLPKDMGLIGHWLSK